MMKNVFSEAKKLKKCPRTTVFKICKYDKNERKKSNESFDLHQDSENIFYASYFHEKPLLGVSTIEGKIKAMNLQKVQKRR